MNDQIFVGRRKTSVARVIVKNGSGQITVNGKPLKEYFPQAIHQGEVMAPLVVTETSASYDVSANVEGGGLTGQAQAVKLGIARSLVDTNPDFRAKFKVDSLLTRDPRMVERKKYGRPKARKKFQFSKR